MDFTIDEQAQAYLESTGAIALIPDLMLANRKKEFESLEYQCWKFIRKGVGNWLLICKSETGKEVYRRTVRTFAPLQDNILKYEFLIIKGELRHIIQMKKHFYQDENTGKTCWVIK